MSKEKEIVFFVNMEQFKTTKEEMTGREIIEDFVKEKPDEVCMQLRQGNTLQDVTDFSAVITLVNGMKFVVDHKAPTTVS